MTYASEHIASSLKEARESKGLSQRELSKRSGVPQSHISKIESNAVDLRLSSLTSLAHALDMELTLIPRKAAPAVRSLARSTAAQGGGSHNDALRELAKVQRSLDALPLALKENTAVDALQKNVAELHKFRSILQETDALRNIRQMLENIETSGGLKNIQKAAKNAQNLRNMLVHNVSALSNKRITSRPAYSLDEDDSDD
ncbi:helix-turn-helix domain-containing protein [Cribrihabitans pelagius]|uniref:helix-turn-helix domain-containing protein n=1 Tax=Cribrihabitans pelagius TaxID=1765746 RepID=UPI003B5B2C89